MPKGKNYTEALKALPKEPITTIAEAVKLVKETSKTKFAGTAELHCNLGIDPKQAEQAIRTVMVLPHGTGKKLKIAAVVGDEEVKAAKAAGAEAAGLEDLIEELGKGRFKYDIIIATPDSMKKLGKIAKVLGQKGLMPNPKSGTITTDVTKTLDELARGRVEIRNDKEGNVHTVFGKSDFKEAELENNLKAVLGAIRDAKPSNSKGVFIKSATVTSSMGPAIKLNVNAILEDMAK